MRHHPADYEVFTPYSLDEALAARAAEAWVPLAGATDLMVYLESGTLPPCRFLNLQELSELRFSGAGSFVPALTTYRDVRTTDFSQRFPLLARAAAEVGAIAIQSRGTWVGNVANASPAADGVPALLVYDAELELRSLRGTRRVLLDRFYCGYKQMDMSSDELISGIHLRLPSGSWQEYYRKAGARRFQAISKTLLAGRIRMEAGNVVGDVRLAFASVAPFPLRAQLTEAILRGRVLDEAVMREAAVCLQDEIKPIDDIRSNEQYRRRVSGNLLAEFLRAAAVS